MRIDGGDSIGSSKRKKLNVYFEQYFYIPMTSSVTISSVKLTRFCPRQIYSPVSDSDTESKSRIPFECWFGNINKVVSFLNQYLKHRKILIHKEIYMKSLWMSNLGEFNRFNKQGKVVIC